MTFCDVFKTSQIHLKKDVSFVTSLRRLKNISKKMSFVMSLRALEHISKMMSIPWRLWNVSKTSLASICNFSKYPAKMVLYDFCRVITIPDKIDVRPLETLKKWNVFWEQFIDISQVCHEYQWADICVWVLASRQSSKHNSRCIIYYSSEFFFFFYKPLLLLRWNTEILAKIDKKLRN